MRGGVDRAEACDAVSGYAIRSPVPSGGDGGSTLEILDRLSCMPLSLVLLHDFIHAAAYTRVCAYLISMAFLILHDIAA